MNRDHVCGRKPTFEKSHPFVRFFFFFQRKLPLFPTIQGSVLAQKKKKKKNAGYTLGNHGRNKNDGAWLLSIWCAAMAHVGRITSPVIMPKNMHKSISFSLNYWFNFFRNWSIKCVINDICIGFILKMNFRQFYLIFYIKKLI